VLAQDAGGMSKACTEAMIPLGTDCAVLEKATVDKQLEALCDKTSKCRKAVDGWLTGCKDTTDDNMKKELAKQNKNMETMCGPCMMATGKAIAKKAGDSMCVTLTGPDKDVPTPDAKKACSDCKDVYCAMLKECPESPKEAPMPDIKLADYNTVRKSFADTLKDCACTKAADKQKPEGGGAIRISLGMGALVSMFAAM